MRGRLARIRSRSTRIWSARTGEQHVEPAVADDPADDRREDYLEQPVAGPWRVLEDDGDANRIDSNAHHRMTVALGDQDVRELMKKHQRNEPDHQPDDHRR